MAGLFNINVVHSTSHWLVPKIIIAILIVLGFIIIVTEGIDHKKKGEPFFGVHKKFFKDGYDKVKFWGTLLLFVLYIISMGIFGFLVSSIVFIFLFNALFCATKEKKSLLTSALISVVSSVSIWYVFGVLFNVTLPTGLFF